MSRHPHHRAGAVAHQDEVGHPYRQGFPGKRVSNVYIQGDAFFLHSFQCGLGRAGTAVFLDKCCDVRAPLRGGNSHGMFEGYRHITDAEQGIGTGSEHRELFRAAGNRKINFNPFRASDPVALHGAHGIGPAIEAVQFFQQLLTVIGNLQEPLRYFFPFHYCAGTPAPAVYHLLVGQYGLVYGIPVNRRGLLVNQPFPVQLGKKPLFPAVVLRPARGDFPAPVIGKPQALQLGAHVVDVLVGPLGRRHAVLYCRVLRRQAEGVPAHGLEHVPALQTLVAGYHVAYGVISHMSDMQLPAGVGKHGKAIKLFPVRIFRYLEGAGLFPRRLDFGLYFPGLVRYIHLE